MIVCPSCSAADGVVIEANADGPDQWSSRCDPCGHRWTFSDEL